MSATNADAQAGAAWKQRVRIVVGDIAQADTEAVVNAANNELWMGSGVAGALKRAGGASIEQEALAQAPIAVGEAVLTRAGDLPALYVIHAASMPSGGPANPLTVRAATASALQLAAESDIDSISFPALGTGAGEVSLEDSARSMFGAMREHLEGYEVPAEIHLVLINESTAQVFRDAFDAA